jgi:putative FmdB family regulatory protein
MPIYEYACESCNGKFEHLARKMSSTIASDEKVKCPDCGSEQTRRALSVFAVGGEGGAKTSGHVHSGPGCCRCGGPGPCGMD